MLNYFEYLKQYFNVPTKIIIGLVLLMLCSQVVGEILNIKGKVVPEILQLRKYLARKKEEQRAIRALPQIIKEFEGIRDLSETLREFKTLMKEWNDHYSSDNIKMRDNWMKNVDNKENCLEEQANKLGKELEQLNKKIDKIGETVLNQSIEDRRNAIINFAQIVIDENAPVTREQFKRIFKIHAEYEAIIEENDRTNGEIDIAIQIIREAYEYRMRNYTFIEDIRGYNAI